MSERYHTPICGASDWTCVCSPVSVQWGDDNRSAWRRIDWKLCAFLVGWSVVFGLFVYIGLERGAA